MKKILKGLKFILIKKQESKNIEEDEGIEDGKMIIEKVGELKDDFNALGSDCFNCCSEEKIHCLATYLRQLLCTISDS